MQQPLYSPGVLDHFRHPRNAGDLAEATLRVEVTNPVCGDVLQLAVQFDGAHFVEVRFRARGCVSALACGSIITEMVQGKTRQDAGDITAQRIADALGGLPPAARHAAELARDALEAVLKQLP